MQLILGPAARFTNPLDTCCFFCRRTFTIKKGDLNFVVQVDERFRKHLKDQHACPDCARQEDKDLINKLRNAASTHRNRARKLREQADVEDEIAQAYQDLPPDDIERIWVPGVF